MAVKHHRGVIWEDREGCGCARWNSLHGGSEVWGVGACDLVPSRPPSPFLCDDGDGDESSLVSPPGPVSSSLLQMRTLRPREDIGRPRSHSREPALVQATQLVSSRLALCWRQGCRLGVDVESSLTWCSIGCCVTLRKHPSAPLCMPLGMGLIADPESQLGLPGMAQGSLGAATGRPRRSVPC